MAVDYAALKAGGFMRQKQKDTFSLRLRVVGGTVTTEQLTAIKAVADKYGQGYIHLTSRQGIEIPFIKLQDIDEVKAACPETKLIIIAPFVLEGLATCNTEEVPNRLERFRVDVAEKAAAAKRIAEKYDLPLIELQPAFDEACKKAPASYWTGDGVHPTACGHEIIKKLWIETFDKIK